MTEHPEGKSYSAGTYSKYKCRCDLCRAANTEAVARRRGKRPQQNLPPSQLTAKDRERIAEHRKTWTGNYIRQNVKAGFSEALSQGATSHLDIAVTRLVHFSELMEDSDERALRIARYKRVIEGLRAEDAA